MVCVLDLADFTRVQPATGGFDTQVLRLERDSRRWALRIFRPGQSAVLERELLALRTARAAGIPVPRVHAIGTYDARPGMLLDWCPGEPLLDAIRTRPWSTPLLSFEFGRLHARLHQVRAPETMRSTWIDWAGPLPSLLRVRLDATSDTSPRLLHMDFHPLNILVHRGRPSAVLDWVNAHAGDPRADVARTVTILRLAPPLGGTVERTARLALELGWRAGYGRFGPNMPLFYAWAGAAMLHDLSKRNSPAELVHVERWTAAWLRRAGIR
jgi:aminoglycoside phosphotransferase (APT) family kinase protein